MIKSIIRQEIVIVEQEVKELFLTEYLTEIAAEKALYAIHITTHKGKLEQIPSINTSSLTNPYCIERSKNQKTICSKCYSNSLSTIRKQLERKLVQNSKVLSENRIPYEKLPTFNNLYVRFSSFGDLINLVHLNNLVRIAIKNPKTTFALWTKRTDIIKEYMKDDEMFDPYYRYEFPSNLIIIYSNPMLDKPMYKTPKGYDKVFQVFSKQFIAETNQKINCGANNCFECLKCYSFNSDEIISEVLK